MVKRSELSPFLPLDEVKGVYVAHKANLRCSAIQLKDGGVCLFSPVSGIGESAQQSLAEIGKVTYLLAPNHYHNKGLTEYSSVFPKAKLCASPSAIPRLQKQTGLQFDNLTGLTKSLKKGMSFLEPAGLKTGEVWLRVMEKKLKAWLVVDALAGDKITAKSDRTEEPGFLKTFPNFAVQEKEVYVDWFYKQLKKDQPRLIVPCHGTMMAASDLPIRVKKTIAENF